jgi:hypothetical protein
VVIHDRVLEQAFQPVKIFQGAGIVAKKMDVTSTGSSSIPSRDASVTRSALDTNSLTQVDFIFRMNGVNDWFFAKSIKELE